MPGLLQSSRIAILMVPVPIIAEVALQRGVPLDPLVQRTLPRLLEFLTTVIGRPILLAAGQVWLNRAPPWVNATFAMQEQPETKTRWCWATVAASVADSFHPGTQWTQCELAKKELGRTDCCGAGPACNDDHELSLTLTRAGVQRLFRTGKALFGELRGEIDNAYHSPICWRIVWTGGSTAHFTVIYAYAVDAGDEWVAVADPSPGQGPTTLSMAQLTAGAYEGGGTWTHTYFTQP